MWGVGNNLNWTEGLFMYRATVSAIAKNTPVVAYAMKGTVKGIQGYDIEIGTDGSPDSKNTVRLIPADKGNLLTLRRSDGSLSEKTVPFTVLKKGDRIEAYSLKYISENYFGANIIYIID